MDSEEFRTRGREMVDYIADYMDTIGSRRPLPQVTPGYLRELIPSTAPDKGENFDAVLADVERVIMPGVTHWMSPNFHAYFSSGNSYPSLLGDMLSHAISGVGFTWAANPACTELEVVLMDWLGQMLQLPNEFLFSEHGKGGGVIQGSASEATLVALLAARTAAINKARQENPEVTKGQVIDKLVAYTSAEAHSASIRAAMMGLVTLRQLPTDDGGSVRGATLLAAIEEDKKKGLTPFFMIATVGTTVRCTSDNLKELGPICNQHDVWMHVDAAYAGSACICPEYRYLIDGVEFCMSFNFNPHKWLQVAFDCSAMWVKDRYLIAEAFDVSMLIVKQDQESQTMPEYRHWQIPFGRRFRSLKLWFVLRMFGVEGLQAAIRKDVGLAKQFEKLVRADSRFEIMAEVVGGLVTFRLKTDNASNERLNKMINDSRLIHMTPSEVKGIYFLRFAVCGRSRESDVAYAWRIVQETADSILPRAGGSTNTRDTEAQNKNNIDFSKEK